MKVRIRFSKQGNMKFIGHLDIMRYFQKAIRRAGIDIAYTEGMSPHMVMSFASPLGVGLTADAEYMDIELRTPMSASDAIEALNRVGAEGITVTGMVRVPEGKASKAMTLVSAADYTIGFRPGHAPAAGWEKGLDAFFSQTSILVLKKTKKSEKEVDIRPMIYDWSIQDEKVFLRLAAGSAANLKPELVMETYLKTIGFTPDPFAFEINRCDIYADLGENGEHALISLYDLGEKL